MALINCTECERQISDKASTCPGCGAPVATVAAVTHASAQPLSQEHTTSSRGVYILLALLFGAFGFHNFYLGFYGRGVLKIAVLLVTFVMDASTNFYSGFSLIALVLFCIIAIIEAFAVRRDSNGRLMS